MPLTRPERGTSCPRALFAVGVLALFVSVACVDSDIIGAARLVIRRRYETYAVGVTSVERPSIDRERPEAALL